MILSILADHPYYPVNKTQGESDNLCPTKTFSTLSDKIYLNKVQSPSNDAFCSSAFFFSY